MARGKRARRSEARPPSRPIPPPSPTGPRISGDSGRRPGAPVEHPHRSARSATIYAFTIFLSAFLLFQVQLIMGKYILPWYGGTPAVWNTCMLVYQVLLLGGYAYAHVVSVRLSGRGQAWAHLALLALSLAVVGAAGFAWRTPLTPGPAWKPEHGDPVWQIMLLLGATIALPFFILSTTGPLVQRWFSRTHTGRSPYRLYALSNLGSLLGLVSYPFLVERWLPLDQQAWVWAVLYAVFAAACGLAAWRLSGSGDAVASPSAGKPGDAPAPGIGRRILWMALAACASIMLLGTTNLLSQEIGVIPFLWVLGLSLYLLTFIICFDNDRWYRRGIFHPLYLFGVLVALAVLSPGPEAPVIPQLIGCSLVLFAVCMVCHGELVRTKPPARYLTSFYLTVAAGGALGGIFVVLVAPQIFKYVWEFQLGLLGAGALLIVALWHDERSWLHRAGSWAPGLALLGAVALPQVGAFSSPAWWGWLTRVEVYIFVLIITVALAAGPFVFGARGRGERNAALLAGALAVALIVVGYVTYMQQATWQGGILHARNFFGLKSVVEDRNGLWFKHGATFHGLQLGDPRRRMEPTLYFGRSSGIGLLLDSYPRPTHGGLRVGVVGLGIATLATYAREDDYYRFYEIDPQVSAYSLGPDPPFTFLRDAKGKWEIVTGDARLMLERELDRGEQQQFDVLILDAFSSDSIPVHLLTKQAMEVYLKHLRGPDSVLAFNVANRHVDMPPLLLRLGREYQLAFTQLHVPGLSRWVFMSPDRTRIQALESLTRATPVAYDATLRIWTDNFSNLFDVLRRQ